MKLIVTDLDRTLLRSDKTVSEYTVNIFNKCREKGYMTAFATARAEGAMVRFTNAIKPDAIISSGGAMVTVKGKTIYSNLLSQDDVRTIIRMCTEFTNGKGLITAESVDGYFCNFTPDDPDRLCAFEHRDFSDFKTPCYKITAELESDDLGKAIAKACSDCAVISYTGEKWRRFATASSTKEAAVHILSEYLGIELSDVIAFGDDINDLSMLKIAGTSVAVSNAIPEVRYIADHVTETNDEDGVAKYLDKTLLGE